MSVDLLLIKHVLTSLAKSVLALGLTAAALATDGSGTTTLVFSNEDLDDIMKIVKALKEFGLLIKDISEISQNKAKEQKGGFLGLLLGI